MAELCDEVDLPSSYKLRPSREANEPAGPSRDSAPDRSRPKSIETLAPRFRYTRYTTGANGPKKHFGQGR